MIGEGSEKAIRAESQSEKGSTGVFMMLRSQNVEHEESP